MSLTKVSYSMITGAPVNVLDFGANTVPGTTDMTAIIQTAHDSIVNSGVPGVLEFPAGTYKCTSGLTINCGFVSCRGNRAVLNFSSVGDIVCITFIGGNPFGGSAPYNQADFQFESFKIQGPGRGIATAIYLNQVNSGGMGPSHTVFRDLNISEFKYGVRGGNHSYLTMFDHIDIWNSTKAYFFPTTGVDGIAIIDYGANYTFLNGTLYGNDDHFQSNSTRTDYSFFGTTFGELSGNSGATSKCIFLAANTQGCLLSGCHFESIGQHVNLGASGNATVSGSTFLSGSATQDKLIENAGFMTIVGGVISTPSGNTNVVYSTSRIHITNVQKVSASVSFYTLSGQYWLADLDDNSVITTRNFVAANIASYFDTQVIASVSVPTATPTVMTTLPTIALAKMYLVTIQSTQGNAIYSGFTVIATDISSSRLIYDGSGSQATITVSGLNVSVTQTSGTTKTYFGSIVRLS